jgi:hypothetical protein
MKAIKKWFARNYAPYAVHIVPSNIFETRQVIYCWTRATAVEWFACSLRSDRAFIVRRACKIQPRIVVAARSTVKEV